MKSGMQTVDWYFQLRFFSIRSHTSKNSNIIPFYVKVCVSVCVCVQTKPNVYVSITYEHATVYMFYESQHCSYSYRQNATNESEFQRHLQYTYKLDLIVTSMKWAQNISTIFYTHYYEQMKCYLHWFNSSILISLFKKILHKTCLLKNKKSKVTSFTWFSLRIDY